MSVRKLISLNPDQYKTISYEDAINRYLAYMNIYLHSQEDNSKQLLQFKTIYQWLETEI